MTLQHKPYIPKQYWLACFLWLVICAGALAQTQANQIVIELNGMHTPALDALFYAFTLYAQWQVLVPALALMAIAMPRLRSKNFLVAIALAYSALSSITFALKNFFSSPRPLSIIFTLHKVPYTSHAYAHTMPSGHTATAFAMSTFLIALFAMPQWLKALLCLCAIGCGISRVYLAQHFLADVVVGTLLGLGIGYGLSLVIRRYLPL